MKELLEVPQDIAIEMNKIMGLVGIRKEKGFIARGDKLMANYPFDSELRESWKIAKTSANKAK